MSDEVEDLVERLLDWPYQGETMAHEAAARIEQLTAERDRLRAAGEKAICHITGYGEASTARIELRAALKGETP